MSTSDDDDVALVMDIDHELMIGLNHLASNISTLFSKNSNNTNVYYEDANITGWIINGTLFDEQIFQFTRSSCIENCSHALHNYDRYIQNSALRPARSLLDTHLFKLTFILTLTDALIGKELIINFCPCNDEILQEIQHYQHFCFPELHAEHRTELVDDSSTYIFTRTLANGNIEYGFCRRIKSNNHDYPIVICIGINRCLTSSLYFSLD
jgi:hypothetical protein